VVVGATLALTRRRFTTTGSDAGRLKGIDLKD
jgi:hypothetical protein